MGIARARGCAPRGLQRGARQRRRAVPRRPARATGLSPVSAPQCNQSRRRVVHPYRSDFPIDRIAALELCLRHECALVSDGPADFTPARAGPELARET